jgi:hypothetical protein
VRLKGEADTFQTEGDQPMIEGVLEKQLFPIVGRAVERPKECDSIVQDFPEGSKENVKRH